MHIAFVILGYISMMLTTISYIPQIITVFIHKSGKNISYPYLALLVVDVILYLIYGIGFLLDNNTDAIPMVIGACLQISLLAVLTILKVSCNTMKKISTKQEEDTNVEETINDVTL
jgi:MtN3 and saliva related transmembrane protein